jgi:hypothetical protein
MSVEREPAAERTNRRAFLKQLGKTAAIGLGLSVLPAGVADAASRRSRLPDTCCVYCTVVSCPGPCTGGKNRFYCQGSGTQGYFCKSHSCSSYCEYYGPPC